MPKWSDDVSIKEALLKKWKSGRILCNALKNDGLFPLRIKLRGPTSTEMSAHFAQVLEWIATIRSKAKGAKGYGYILEEREAHHRLSGKNMIPAYAIIPTLEDAVQLLKEQASLRWFKKNSNALLAQWACLQEWVLRNPFQVVLLEAHIGAVLQVLRWFAQHERRDLYLRQLDIEGVDTKFIEAHKGLLTQLLDIILPPNQVNPNSNSFESRYGLKTKPHLIRFRILDESLAPYGCTDISLPLSQFGRLKMPFSRVFIVENEINFLSFPTVPNACVIFGAGYRVDSLGDISWLSDKEIFYWGDIDTHGLNILSMVRSFLPQTQSFLMSEDILLSHRSLWSNEKTPFTAEIIQLTPQEQELSKRLQAGVWGAGVRLEQERIRFSEVAHFIAALP